MTTKNRKDSFKKAKMQLLSNRKRQENYDLRYSVIEKKKTYNAMDDPHASYYFYSQSVRNHLKNIKTAALNQTTHTDEKKRLKKLFRQKIKPKIKSFSINFPEFQDQSSNLDTIGFRKTSLQPVHSPSYKSPRRQSQRQTKMSINSIDRYNSLSKRHFNNKQMDNNVEQRTDKNNSPSEWENDKLSGQEQKVTKIQIKISNKNENSIKNQRQIQQRRKRYDQLHIKRHRTFLNFIEEKKKLLQGFQQAITIRNQL